MRPLTSLSSERFRGKSKLTREKDPEIFRVIDDFYKKSKNVLETENKD